MIKLKKNFFFPLTIIIFIFFVAKYYFSEENIQKTQRLRSIYYSELINKMDKLPILNNDTKNIIDYKNISEDKSKRKFWELIK